MGRRVFLVVAVVALLLAVALAEGDYGLKPGYTQKIEAFEKWYKGASLLACFASAQTSNKLNLVE